MSSRSTFSLSTSIPEFIGRLPMVSVLDELSEEELVAVLTETRNALTKQYTKLFSMDNVGLTFTKDALKALAQEAVRKGTGARALRAILEKIMLDLMYDLPSREDILEVTINRAVIDGKKSPLIRRKQMASGLGISTNFLGLVADPNRLTRNTRLPSAEKGRG